MTIPVYYFSGTGNSLAVARGLAERLGACPQPLKTGEEPVHEDGDMIGLVFPVYNHLIPLVVKTFVERWEDLDGKYIFAVCTYGDSPCAALKYLERLIQERGGSLAAGFAVKMPYNYIGPGKGFSGVFKSFVLREYSEEDIKRLFSACREKLDLISNYVKAKKQGTVEAEYQGLERAVDILNLRETLQKSFWLKKSGYRGKTDLPYIESVRLMDHGFYSDANCIHCGTCAEVCPADNIELGDDGARWRHRCLQCFACLQWCPAQSIQFGGGTAGGKRYHHPDISHHDIAGDKINKNQ